MAASSIIPLALLAIVLVAGIIIYSQLTCLRNAVANAFAQIDVQLKRRYDLIPNLVETARKYLQHERETLEVVIAARNQAHAAAGKARADLAGAGNVAALGAAEAALGGALGKLMVVVEAYPALKADRNMRAFAEELTSTENRIGFARQAYNDGGLTASTSGPTTASGDAPQVLPGAAATEIPTGQSDAWLDDLLAITWPADLIPTTLAFLVPPEGSDELQVWRSLGGMRPHHARMSCCVRYGACRRRITNWASSAC